VPIFYVFPIDKIGEARRDSGWNKVQIKNIDNFEIYINNWDLIKKHLTP